MKLNSLVYASSSKCEEVFEINFLSAWLATKPCGDVSEGFAEPVDEFAMFMMGDQL